MTGEYDQTLISCGYVRSPMGILAMPARGHEALDRIRDGYAPGAADLQGAPELEDWCPAPAIGGFALLCGIVSGHPVLVDGRFIRTSVLLATDGGSWARTWNRWYRLGDPLDLRTWVQCGGGAPGD